MNSAAELHHLDAAPAPGKNFDAATAPTLLYTKLTFKKQAKVNIRFSAIFSHDFFLKFVISFYLCIYYLQLTAKQTE
jgi:hypothetical protein